MRIISRSLLAMALLWATVISVTTYAAEEEDSFSPQELQQLLAPIALYPDTVLTHVLIASTYPLEVIRADRWRQANLELESEEAINAGEDKGWDPSVSALLAFPDLLTRMSEDLDWTQRLGEAFLYSEVDVLSAIQALRQQAFDSGSLTDLEHMDVSHEDGNIIIAPIRREVVYVPYYDSHTVYGSWLWPSYPPAYWSHSYARNYNHRGFYWGIFAPVHYGFYFSGFHWGHRNIVVIHDHHARRNFGRYYSGHQLRNHRRANHWRHQPRHRRGVRYRDTRMQHRNWNTNGRTQVAVQRNNNTARSQRSSDRLANNRVRNANARQSDRTTNRTITRNREYNSAQRDSLRQRLSNGKKSGPKWRAGTPAERTVNRQNRNVNRNNVNRERATSQARNSTRQTAPRRDPTLNTRVQREVTQQTQTRTRTVQPTTTTRSTTRSETRSTTRTPTRSTSRQSRTPTRSSPRSGGGKRVSRR